MPLKYFNCPDNSQIAVSDCLAKCPRPEGRCLSLPTLYDIGYTREWPGKPSTTQLLNPTRYSYLHIKAPYAINPTDMAFALLGTRHHKRLEGVAKKLEGLEAEMKLGGDVTGILDLLEPDELKDGFWKLTDYKTWGSYAVAKHLGLKNNGVYERQQLALQLNNYRVKAEALGFNISRLLVQCTVRDGGTYMARNNNVNDKILLLPVDILDDTEVKQYFKTNAEALITAVETDTMPELCDYDGRWGNRRCCPEYCPVVYWCPEGAKMAKVELRQL